MKIKKVNELKLTNSLIAVTLSLIILISLSYSIHTISRMFYLKKASQTSLENIRQLEYSLDNIDQTNAQYIIDVFYSKNSIYSSSAIDLVLQELWSYELFINGEKATSDNITKLVKIENTEIGKEVTVEFRESMKENNLPYLLSKRGSIINSDFSDSFITFISVAGLKASQTNTFIENQSVISEENKLFYKFIKDGKKVDFKLSFILMDRLKLGSFQNSIISIG